MLKACVYVTALVAAVVSATPIASAADIPTKAPPYAPAYSPVPYFNWSAFYLGANGGGAWGTSRHSDTLLGNATGDFDISGGLIGGTAGLNYQIGPWVWGLEGDLDWSRIRGNSRIGGLNYDSYLQWLGTARGRVGFAFDRFLPYVTGGLAVGDLKASIIPPTVTTGTDTRAGWTVGAGVEYGITPNLTAKAEYLYVDLGSGTRIAGDTIDLKSHVVRGGLNWRFNWDGPRRY
jgi:outer membrane immunogenic protein